MEILLFLSFHNKTNDDEWRLDSFMSSSQILPETMMQTEILPETGTTIKKIKAWRLCCSCGDSSYPSEAVHVQIYDEIWSWCAAA